MMRQDHAARRRLMAAVGVGVAGLLSVVVLVVEPPQHIAEVSRMWLLFS